MVTFLRQQWTVWIQDKTVGMSSKKLPKEFFLAPGPDPTHQPHVVPITSFSVNIHEPHPNVTGVSAKQIVPNSMGQTRCWSQEH